MQNKTSVFDKKVITRFDKKKMDIAKKQHWRREESITACPKEEDPISEDSKKTLLLRTLRRILSMRNLKMILTVKPKDNAINWDPQELQDPHWLWRLKLTLSGFLIMVYDRVDDGDKFSKKKFGLGSLCFHAISDLNVSPVLIGAHRFSLFTCYVYRAVSSVSNKCDQCIL